jgi:hypothetical protein
MSDVVIVGAPDYAEMMRTVARERAGEAIKLRAENDKMRGLLQAVSDAAVSVPELPGESVVSTSIIDQIDSMLQPTDLDAPQ